MKMSLLPPTRNLILKSSQSCLNAFSTPDGSENRVGKHLKSHLDATGELEANNGETMQLLGSSTRRSEARDALGMSCRFRAGFYPFVM